VQPHITETQISLTSNLSNRSGGAIAGKILSLFSSVAW